ncbi:MAG: hypothetical protein JWP03_4555 [Phycisphaerales bacterium]|nr:hypothetical protein [Phycisphaerales bacterium]
MIASRWTWIAGYALVALLGLRGLADDSVQQVGREAPPADSAQAGPTKLVRELFKSEYASRDPVVRRGLARKLFDEAAKSTGDPAGRYVLLRESRDVAAAAGDLGDALNAADEIAASYDVKSLDQRLIVLGSIGNAAQSPASTGELAEAYTQTSENALSSNDVVAAAKCAASATSLARRSGDAATIAHAAAQAKRVQEAQEFQRAVETARQKLRNDPSDPEANLLLGRAAAFKMHDWGAALPLLAKSKDSAIRSIAKMELAATGSVPDAAAMEAIADAWWALSASSGVTKNEAQSRAAHWYGNAVPELTGLKKTVAEKRVEEVALSAADPTRVVNLLPLIDARRDAIGGDWKFVNRELVTDGGKWCSLRIPYEPPTEYDFRVSFTRVQGNGAVAQLISRSSRGCAWIMGWRGNTVCGLDMIGGQGADGDLNPTHDVRQSVLTNGRVHVSLMQIRKDSITTFLDGKVITKFKTDYSNVGGIRDRWGEFSTKTPAIGLGSENSQVVFHSADLTPVSGTGRRVLPKP